MGGEENLWWPSASTFYWLTMLTVQKHFYFVESLSYIGGFGRKMVMVRYGRTLASPFNLDPTETWFSLLEQIWFPYDFGKSSIQFETLLQNYFTFGTNLISIWIFNKLPWNLQLLNLCLVFVIWTERRMSKLVLNVKFFNIMI